ncbi:Uncharacterised protein [Vibrio cholerae]|nr:Uncharacterised protein [Vibrio cholerae]
MHFALLQIKLGLIEHDLPSQQFIADQNAQLITLFYQIIGRCITTKADVASQHIQFVTQAQ